MRTGARGPAHVAIWACAVFTLLALASVLFARIATTRVAAATRADLENVLEVVPSGHFAYLGARIAAGMQLAHLGQLEPAMTPAALARLAAVSVEHLPGIAGFALETAGGDMRWFVPQAPPGLDLERPLATLQARAQADPGLLATAVVDLSPWGRTLLVRFPLPIGRAQDESLVGLFTLAPLYETLFSEDFRARLDFEVREGSTLLYQQVSEPWPDSPFRVGRSFSVAGHQWTMTVWPRRSLITARLSQTWSGVFWLGLAGAFVCAILFALGMMRWTAMTRRTQEAEIATALLHVAQVLNTRLDEPGMLERVTELALETLGCAWSAVFLRDGESAELRLMESTGLADGRDGCVPAVDLHALAPALQSRTPVDVEADGSPKSPLQTLTRSLGVASGLYVPIARGDEVLGLLGSGYLTPGSFSTKQRQLALGISHAMAIALENTHLIADLQTASRLKSDFVATMSHELRTPLNVITGYADMLRDDVCGPLTGEQRDTLDRVHRSAVDLLELVNATLDLSRLEAGRQLVDLEIVDVEQLFGTLAGELEALVPADVTLEWHNGVGREPLVTDRGQVKTILKNLIGNALKFTPAGSVAVTAREAGGLLTLEVRDSGIGIAPADLPVIFEMFRQGDSSPTRRYGGIGLGLHIVRRLVDLLGGTITVTSVPGAGSTFTVTVPVSSAANGARATAV